MLGEETTTATSATVTIAPRTLNAFSPIVSNSRQWCGNVGVGFL
jgi:hypothetical protein